MLGPHDPDGPEIATAPEAPQASAWNLPNALTMLRVVLVPVFIWLLMRDAGYDDDGGVAADWVGDRWWATVVFVVATVTEWVDGDLARRKGLITAFGKLMDPIADKLLTCGALVVAAAFGAPSYVIGEDIFWGQDRLEFVAKRLAEG